MLRVWSNLSDNALASLVHQLEQEKDRCLA